MQLNNVSCELYSIFIISVIYSLLLLLRTPEFRLKTCKIFSMNREQNWQHESKKCEILEVTVNQRLK